MAGGHHDAAATWVMILKMHVIDGLRDQFVVQVLVLTTLVSSASMCTSIVWADPCCRFLLLEDTSRKLHLMLDLSKVFRGILD